MTRVILLNHGDTEMRRLAAALPGADPDVRIDATEGAHFARGLAAEADVALVALGQAPDARERALLAQLRSAGLPIVALLPDASRFDSDLARTVADFCLPPFRPEEVALRLRAAAYRARPNASARRITAGDLSIDEERYEVRVSGRKVDLTYKEYELLKLLAANPGRVFSREALLRTVWEYDYFGGTRTVDVHVRRLRAKINDVNRRYIETVWNVGYRFHSGDSAR